MLILAKSILGITLGFILAIITGLIILPFLRKMNARQTVSRFINPRHLKKEGTPTIGGLIFIIPTLISVLVLSLRGSIVMNHNLVIVLFVFISYAILGFIDDYLKVKMHNNKGLSVIVKFICQLVIAIVVYYIYVENGGATVLEISLLGIKWNLGIFYAVFVLFLLVATTNAVNITDGLDGLCGSLSAMAFLAYGIISYGSTWIVGYDSMALFCFILLGSIFGFLLFNTYPARVFMGDTGSLALGGALASVAILTHHEISLALIGGVFVIETLSSLIQIIAIRRFHKKVFLKAPLHHHFEELGWSETDIVKIFLVAGFLLAMFGVIYGVWL
ncbi:MAG TPA: phospho-N-acetylmuramoyl-pentapeptide-transferase [Bacilli bacterium]|jgi:phospho-N-acetylmuramoyl-pentapeptide-transferase|nr:phospho-N-acetylmuramoyl-pentapeptide-transferase [Bacilli bacterium]HPZ23765.1 phospho-N-acetylmuramoyl-pentapeptide-transferase [Bacilli bacterium]HQC83324.1 phospho-N-acetylmuramoyl-pentapeptide-transferase [Bacilli bacterium]